VLPVIDLTALRAAVLAPCLLVQHRRAQVFAS
jgi:hypothetical protein